MLDVLYILLYLHLLLHIFDTYVQVSSLASFSVHRSLIIRRYKYGVVKRDVN